MKQPTIKSAIIAIVLGGGLYGLCANSHIDIFPCEITSTTHQPGTSEQIKTTSGTCSLLMASYPPGKNDAGKITSYHEINTGGYIVCGIVFGLIPIGVGLFFGGSAAKEEEEEAPQAPSSDDGEAGA